MWLEIRPDEDTLVADDEALMDPNAAWAHPPFMMCAKLSTHDCRLDPRNIRTGMWRSTLFVKVELWKLCQIDVTPSTHCLIRPYRLSASIAAVVRSSKMRGS